MNTNNSANVLRAFSAALADIGGSSSSGANRFQIPRMGTRASAASHNRDPNGRVSKPGRSDDTSTRRGTLYRATRVEDYDCQLRVVRVVTGNEVQYKKYATLKSGKGFKWDLAWHESRDWKEEVMRRFMKFPLEQQSKGVEFVVHRNRSKRIIWVSEGTPAEERK